MKTGVQMKPIRMFFVLFLAIGGASSTTSANVSLPDVISDGMVLQQNHKVPIWGKADPGESVTVKFAGQSQTATASADGKWLVKLSPMPANSTAATMTI